MTGMPSEWQLATASGKTPRMTANAVIRKFGAIDEELAEHYLFLNNEKGVSKPNGF